MSAATLLITSLCMPTTIAFAAETGSTSPETTNSITSDATAATTPSNNASSSAPDTTANDSSEEPLATNEQQTTPEADSSTDQSTEQSSQSTEQSPSHSGTSTLPPEKTGPTYTVEYLDALAEANKDLINEGEYTISSALASNLVLDVSNGSTDNGANVQIYQDNASPAQRWKVTKDDKGYLTLTNEGSGKVLDILSGNNQSGANVQSYASNNSRAQKWIAINSNGRIILRSALTGDYLLSLDVFDGRAKSGTNVQSYADNGSRAQQWNFEKIIDMTPQVRAYWNQHLRLGRPTQPAETTTYGLRQTFQHGAVYQWTNANNKVLGVAGDIYAKYASLGAENGILGMPLVNETTLRGGHSQAFQKGEIHQSAAGTFFTRGDIQNYWAAHGWENGWLGYPTSDEVTGLRDGGASQRFQGGTLFWSTASGVHSVSGTFLGDYAARRYEAGDLGYPVNDEHDWNKGLAQDFQHGTLFWNGCGKKGWQNPAQYFQVSSCDVGVPANGKFGYASPSRITMNATRDQAIEAMISRAYDYLGTRYVWDYALQPGVGVDCAGLVMQSLYAAGMDLHEYNPSNHWYDPWHSHDANNMAADSRFMHVSLNDRQRGDLIYWPGHIAIYLGNDQIIEANVPTVRINSLWAYGAPSGALRPFV
ncbi:RICIN domain-containing protein [Bifidobacterium goeldii]|nr:RICIN domain-containing protein [Bifidobacterium goeldii]